MIDAQLGDPGAVADGSSAQLLHQRLFDAELALTNIARFALAMARIGLPAPQHFQACLALRDLVRGQNEDARAHAARLIGLLREAGPVPDGEDRAAVVVAHRFAGSVIALADAITEWMAAGATGEGRGAFQPSVQLFGGWLPGSAQVSNDASLEPGTRPGDRIRLRRYTRTAIQVGAAVGAAIALGDLLSGRRFYWAVIAAFVTFMGANNSGEQVRRALFRVAGTVVGVAAGSLLVSAIGHHTYWSITVILVTLFLGLYLVRINYTFMAIGITRYTCSSMSSPIRCCCSAWKRRPSARPSPSWWCCWCCRCGPAGSCVSPSGTRSRQSGGWPATPATTCWAKITTPGPRCAPTPGPSTPLTRPLRPPPSRCAATCPAASTRTSAGHCNWPPPPGTTAATWSPTPRRPGRSTPARAWTSNWPARPSATPWTWSQAPSPDPATGVYTRSSALFDQAERRLEERSGIAGPQQFTTRDLQAIDGTMAQTAEVLGLSITDYDTVPTGSGSR